MTASKKKKAKTKHKKQKATPQDDEPKDEEDENSLEGKEEAGNVEKNDNELEILEKPSNHHKKPKRKNSADMKRLAAEKLRFQDLKKLDIEDIYKLVMEMNSEEIDVDDIQKEKKKATRKNNDQQEEENASTQSNEERQEMGDVDKQEDLKNVESSSMTADTKCDFVCCAPKCLQPCRSKAVMLFTISWCAFTQSMVTVGLMKSVLTSLERRFGLTSVESGAIVTFNIIGAFIFLLPIAYFGGRLRKLRFLSLCMICISIGSAIFAAPHFINGSYEYSSSISPVCYKGENVSYNGICNNRGFLLKPVMYKIMFWASSILIGIGITAMHLISILYIDDNVQIKESTAYIGAFYGFTVLGSMAGYVMSSFFLQVFFVDITSHHPGLTHEDKITWVGAWWMGFLISSAMCLLIAPALFAFPKELPGIERIKETETYKTGSETQSFNEALSIDSDDLSRRVRRLVFNPTFVCLGLSGLATNLMTSGMSVFGPKYLEITFGIPPGEAAQVFGLMYTAASAGGLVIGSILVYHFHTTVLKTLKVQAFLSLALPPLVVLAFLSPCGPKTIEEYWVGVTHSHYNGFGMSIRESACNKDCHCSNNFLLFSPMCEDKKITYFSPCYAGCTRDDMKNKSYCACIKNQKNNQVHKLKRASCKTKCHLIAYFVLPFATCVLMTYMLATPRLTSILRSVPDRQKPLAFVIQWLVVRFLGSVPGPILMGGVFDLSCQLWKKTCDGRGSCYFYNFQTLKYTLMGICVACQVVVSMSLLSAWYFYQTERLNSRPRGRVISVEVKEEVPEATTNACNSNSTPHQDEAIFHSFHLLAFP